MDLYTIRAGGFSAFVDAFALDEDRLWFLSMLGPASALKAIWGALLKQPPEHAWLVQGVEGALRGRYRRVTVAYETLGTWRTVSTRLPGCGAHHVMLVPRLAEFAFEREDLFLLLARRGEEAPRLHYRFLDRRTALPLHSSWAGWLWERALSTGEAVPLESLGVSAYLCRPDADALRADISRAVRAGALTVPEEPEPGRDGHHAGHLPDRRPRG